MARIKSDIKPLWLCTSSLSPFSSHSIWPNPALLPSYGKTRLRSSRWMDMFPLLPLLKPFAVLCRPETEKRAIFMTERKPILFTSQVAENSISKRFKMGFEISRSYPGSTQLRRAGPAWLGGLAGPAGSAGPEKFRGACAPPLLLTLRAQVARPRAWRDPPGPALPATLRSGRAHARGGSPRAPPLLILRDQAARPRAGGYLRVPGLEVRAQAARRRAMPGAPGPRRA